MNRKWISIEVENRLSYGMRESERWWGGSGGGGDTQRERERDIHLLLDTFGNSRLYLHLFYIYLFRSIDQLLARSFFLFSSQRRLYLTHEIKLSSMRSTRDLLYPRERTRNTRMPRHPRESASYVVENDDVENVERVVGSCA